MTIPRHLVPVALAAALAGLACDLGTGTVGTATIEILAFIDANRSGDQDAGDVAIENATVTLSPEAGGTDQSATTDADGIATFDQVETGSYAASIALPGSVKNVFFASDSVVSILIDEGTVTVGSFFRFVGVEVADLAGDWSATEFRYTDNDIPGLSIDAITDAGGSVTLTAEEGGAFTGSVTIPGLTVDSAGNTITVSIAGTLSVSGDTLGIDFDANTEGTGLFSDFDADYTLAGNVLTFTNPDGSFDFPDTIEEQLGIGARGPVPATLDASFQR